MSDEKTAQEIVIIRRRSHDEEEHGHTGLWKIAYADFMTALMAFFLVMWLVNAANKKTLQQVATYFNPIRMSDQVTTDKGLNNLAGQDKPAEGKKRDQQDTEDGSADPKEQLHDEPKISTVDEQGLFRDPYGLLSELAKEAATFRRGEDQVPQGGSKNTAHDVYSGGSGYRDPFDPDFRQEPSPVEELPSDVPVADGTTSQKEPEPIVAAQATAPDSRSVQEPAPVAASAGDPVKAAEARGKEEAKAATVEEAKPDSVTSPASGAMSAEQAAKTVEEARQLETAVAQMTAEARSPIPNIEVTATKDGVMISLMDDIKFGMFAVGSAKPRPELVAVMERIAGMLKAHDGRVVIRGHTDARPYKSKDYDNWRLSTARAHMAHHMLVHGGVAEDRFERIEGHADRNLKLPDDPNAARNRRIEILIKAVAS